MPKYLIKFSGRRIGSLGSHYGYVSRIVEADDVEDARLRAYDTHERIHGVTRVELFDESEVQS